MSRKLQLNKTDTSDTEPPPLLDLHLSISHGFVLATCKAKKTAFSLERFISRMIEVFLFYIDLTLTFATLLHKMAAKIG